MADGTVLQLYPSQDGVQHLRVYAPSGRMYVLTSRLRQHWPVDERGLTVVAGQVATLG